MLRLEKGKWSTALFVGATGRRVSVIYNLSFLHGPTTPQQPDNVIGVFGAAGETAPTLVLDAKYRIAYDEDYVRQYGSPGPPAETINQMHRYRDAIVVRSGGKTYQRPVAMAAVLFPSATPQEFKTHRFFSSLASVGIGAIPALPQKTSLLEEFVLAIAKRFEETTDVAQ